MPARLPIIVAMSFTYFCAAVVLWWVIIAIIVTMFGSVKPGSIKDVEQRQRCICGDLAPTIRVCPVHSR